MINVRLKFTVVILWVVCAEVSSTVLQGVGAQKKIFYCDYIGENVQN